MGGGGVDSASTGMGRVAAAAVGGFVLKKKALTELSGLWCSPASVLGEWAR